MINLFYKPIAEASKLFFKDHPFNRSVFVLITALNATIHHLAGRNMKWFQFAHRIEPYRATFLVMNIAWSTAYVGQRLDPLLFRALVSGMGFLGVVVVKSVNHYQLLALPTDAQNEGVTISFDTPFREFIEQEFDLFQLSLNVAAAVLSPPHLRFLFGAMSVLNLYTFYQKTQRTWLKITKSFQVAYQQHSIAAHLTYEAIFMLDKRYRGKDSCSICTDPLYPAYHVCSEHSMHQKCLIDLLVSKVKEFNPWVTKMKIEELEEGESYAHYTFNIHQNSLPGCPECRREFPQNILSVETNDPAHETRALGTRALLHIQRTFGMNTDQLPIWRQGIISVFQPRA